MVINGVDVELDRDLFHFLREWGELVAWDLEYQLKRSSGKGDITAERWDRETKRIIEVNGWNEGDLVGVKP